MTPLAAPTSVRSAEAVPVAPEFRVETVTDYPSFLALRKEWNDLDEQAGLLHPFLTHDWVQSWWESFGADHALHIVIVREQAEIVAIAPLMLSRKRVHGISIRRIGSIGNVHTPRNEFILARRQSAACREIWRHLSAHAAQWDMLELCQLPPESCLIEELPRLAAADGFLTGHWYAGESPYLILTGTWDSYLASLDRKHRANLRSGFKRLGALGEVRLETIASHPGLDEALEEGFRIEAAAWKGKEGTAMGCRPELRRFYTAIAHRMAERGWLRLHFLTVGGRRIAFGFHVCRDNRLYLIKPGYLPEYAQYSPCTLMCALVLQDAYAKGITECDFLGVTDSWKTKWTALSRSQSWLYVFQPRWRTRWLHWAKFRLIPGLQQQRWYHRLRAAVLGKVRAISTKKRPSGGA